MYVCHFITTCKKHKRSFLLIELLITLTLMAFLLGVLGFWYRRIYCFQKQKERSYALYVEENRAYKTLRTMFNAALAPRENLPGMLYTLTFDRGVYRDPELAGEVRACLYHDVEGQELKLRISNMKREDKTETLLLLSHVKHVTITYQDAPDPNEFSKKIGCTIIQELPGFQIRTLNYQFALGR
ncbi:DUF1494 domain-containing protein [Candidatus Chlamydia sanziniae]|uniref:Uncharacterized protein n=1 Tax=Candidatus Chlamydia sanziniae TaxID=1806891 RepID=A0A1A9HUE3_9CHLA|nr:DUF1494 domain-containing protein [Candidatus Chlamydia sanziniae]ANH78620.1 hypothetical protein Cs308_0449 [Candidatus Chlamydia sanziniae]